MININNAFLEWPFFDDTHRRLAAELEAWVEAHHKVLEAEGVEETAAVRAIARLLGEGGWLRYLLPATLGGPRICEPSRVDVRSLCIARDVLARCSGIADCTFAMQGLGAVPIVLFGTAAQQSAYLPRIANGSCITGFCLSEAEAGSDVSALQSSARRDGDSYVLSGRKTWISNAGVAHTYIVFARTGEASGAKGLSAFVVDAHTPGLSVPKTIQVVAPHVIGDVAFNDCRVPASRMLGKAGDGFKVAMATLDVMRSTVGAAALGFARRALAEARQHVKSRQVFGQPLAQFQATQMRIADMALAVDTSALLVYRAAWTKDTLRDRVTLEASMAKLHATEAAQHVIDSAVQLLGGLGVTVGSTVERLYREIRPLRIYEGTSEIQKLIIAGQVLGK
ncbi:MAG TPA: acyl-CoA dehydrogenase family protein [Burkholderiales bacterium]|nr:acyl-CoA dehydrogenase family protein [Burkholderiales bacterium]